MPTTSRQYPSGHAHTWLKLPKTNGGAKAGAAFITVLIGILGAIILAVYKGLLNGTLQLPPSLVPYAPWIIIVVGAVAAGVVQSGIPAFHPGGGTEEHPVTMTLPPGDPPLPPVPPSLRQPPPRSGT